VRHMGLSDLFSALGVSFLVLVDGVSSAAIVMCGIILSRAKNTPVVVLCARTMVHYDVR
jgi:hypothetical protein